MWLAASSFDAPEGVLATLANAQLNPKPHQGSSSKNPAPHPVLDERNSKVALGLRTGLSLDRARQSEWDNSSDSRYWGFVPRGNIIGKPVLIYWSYRASTKDLTGESAGSMVSHFIDLGEQFFTRTRWERTLTVVRGFPDSQLPTEPLPLNPGLPDR